MKKKYKIIIICVVILVLIAIASLFGYKYYYNHVYLEKHSNPVITLNGDDRIEIKYGEEYSELGASAKFRDNDISDDIKIDGEVDTSKVGEYSIKYEIEHNGKKDEKLRVVVVIDDAAPVITLSGDETVENYIGIEYNEPGFEATDVVDGNLTESVVVENNININEAGEYQVTYTVKDLSGNETIVTRKVVYVVKPLPQLPSVNAKATSIAVLNYHFFNTAPKGSTSGGNTMSIYNFEEELQWLNDNGYKTLTMEEYRAWMYGEIDLPARSVLLTIDDGWIGTGRSNGNLLIPALEKYNAHATLFWITRAYVKSDFESPNLDIESHSYSMHDENVCSGVSRGAKMLCLTDDEVRQDLKTSIEMAGSDIAFCYPFYAYTSHSKDLVKEAGFKLAFAGGDYKSTRNSDKFAIPRYHMYNSTTLDKFIKMVS